MKDNEILRVAFDIDFTITSDGNYRNIIKELYPGFDIDVHYTKYPLEEALYEHGFITEQQYREAYTEAGERTYSVFCGRRSEMKRMGNLENWFLKVYDFLAKQEGVEIHFFSGREIEYTEETYNLFSKFDIPTNNNIHMVGKSNKSAAKTELAMKLGVDLFFEDNLQTVEHIQKFIPNCQMFLIERPYNTPNDVEGYISINPKDNPFTILNKVEECIGKLQVM